MSGPETLAALAGQRVTIFVDSAESGYPYVRVTTPSFPDWTGYETTIRFDDLGEIFRAKLTESILDGTAGEQTGEVIFGSHLIVQPYFFPVPTSESHDVP